tara:strand:- start:45 stop:605 length:561 start_codon:yes stop_codon:yes gene_type:complete
MDKLDSYDYWFKLPNQGGKNYRSTIVFNGLVKKLKIPTTGFCVQIGVNTGYTFNLMKKYFGEHRTRGIDLFNVNNDPYVYDLNINEIDFNIPIAYAENDVGNVNEDPVPRLNGMKWALTNLVPGGVLITTSNVANKQLGIDVDRVVKSFNCNIYRLDNYNNEDWAKYLNERTIWNTISLMLVTKST